MNVSWMTLRDLEQVVAVAKTSHFGKAAKECHISQPSLSAQIKKIEDYLGVALFERNTRQVKITDAGRKVAAQAAIVLDEARKIPTMVGSLNLLRPAGLKLGVIHSFSPFVSHILPALRKDFAEMPLTLQEGTTSRLIQDLKAGNLDLVLAADTVRDSVLRESPLFFEPLILAAPKGHPILGKKNLRSSDLRASEMVLLEEGHCLRDQILQFCPVNRRGKTRHYHANSIETLRHLVASGTGYTLMPKLASQQNTMSNLISYVEFEDSKVGRRMVFYTRARQAHPEWIQEVMQTIRHATPRELKRHND